MTRSGFLEPAMLGCLIALAALLCGFYGLAEAMKQGGTHSIDTMILMSMRDAHDPSNAIGPAWLGDMMRDISALGGIAVLSLITLLAFIYLLMVKKPGRAFYLAATVITGTMLSNTLKAGFDRPRPDFIPHDITVFTASFPSGHSLMSAVVYLTLGALLAQAQSRGSVKIYLMTIAILLTLTIGISRAYLGVHWPSDVLAGWMVGGAWALLFWTAERLYLKQRR